ncbi:MAG: histidine kinase [Desulfovibrionaceae bacterium]|nr:histidine kinase [Desulfovibrionaceae bacterium]
MNNRIIPITLAVSDKEQKKRFERMISSSTMVRPADDESDEMGVLVYEPGANVEEDLPYIIQALESGQAEDVYLVGNNADPNILIRAMRSGIREFLQYPVEENDFRSAIMRTAMRNSLGVEEGDKGKLFTVLGAKPGVGSSTLAVNLACALNAREPGRTALVDLRRPYGEAHYFLDLSFEYTWADLVEDITRLDATYLRSVMSEHSSGLHVLPGPAAAEKPDAQSLHLILEHLRYSYDYVVVDAACSPEEDLPKEIEHADAVLVALQLTLPCLARAARLLESVRSQDPESDRRIKLVASRVRKNSNIGLSEAAGVLNREIPWTIPEDADSALSAINQGTPLVVAYPKSAAARSILAIAGELDPRPAKARKGLSLPFASLFRRKTKSSDGGDNLAGAAL